MTRVLASLRIAAIGAFAATAVLAAPPSTNPPPAPAGPTFDTTQRATLEKVNNYFNSVTTLVGKFVQVGPDGNKTEGLFYMQKPGKIRFEYDPPPCLRRKSARSGWTDRIRSGSCRASACKIDPRSYSRRVRPERTCRPTS